MGASFAYRLEDSTGAPLTTATPTFLKYVDSSGATVSGAPTIAHIGSGEYVMVAPDAHETSGVAWLIDNGATAFPRYVSGSFCKPTAPLAAAHLEDGSGTLVTSATPTFITYALPGGTPTSAPTISGAAGLYWFKPTAADATNGVVFLLDSGSATTYWPGGSRYLAGNVADAFSAISVALATPAPQPSTYQQALAAPGTVTVLWADFQEELAPPWLRAGSGKGWLRALGDAKDLAELRAKDAVKARMPSYAPVDALGYLASERQIAQGSVETQAAYRTRLKAAWDVWPWAGTPQGLLRALYYAGYPNTAIITAAGAAHTLNGNLNVVTTTVSGYALPSGFWNGFRILFFTPWPSSWAGVPPGNTSDEVKAIRALVSQWKAGHALLEDMQVIGGLVWGYPASQQWGGVGVTWGNAVANTTWTPT